MQTSSLRMQDLFSSLYPTSFLPVIFPFSAIQTVVPLTVNRPRDLSASQDRLSSGVDPSRSSDILSRSRLAWKKARKDDGVTIPRD